MRRLAVAVRLQASGNRRQADGDDARICQNPADSGHYGRAIHPSTLYIKTILAAATLIVLTTALAGCGHSSSTTTTSNTITVTPSSLSMNLGDVASVSASVVDSTGTAITSPPPITFASSNAAIVTVSSAGSVCAGTWDSAFIVCDASHSQAGSANITVSSGTLTTSIPVFTHLHVDRVTVSPDAVDCRSSGQTQQLTAKAFSNGVDVSGAVGPFTWTSQSTDVATVDTNGVVTAKTPGQTVVFASVSAVSSVPATWVTCPVETIRVHVANVSDTTFSIAAAGSTSQLAADVTDSHGVAVSPPLTWSSSQPAVATVNSAALVTAVGAGATGITASCAGSCNIGAAAVYSNVAIGTVAGTSATTVYATGSGATTLIPIDSGTNTAGTAITLPSAPNSFLFSLQGTKGYLGSSAGLITLDVASNSVSQNTTVPGTVLAVSPDGNHVIVASSNLVTVLGVGTNVQTDTASISGVTAADFTRDSLGAYILAGSTIYFWTPGDFRAVALNGSGNDVKFLANGAFAYVAGGAPGPAVTALASCNNSVADTIPTPAVPRFLASLPDASKVLAVDSPGIDVITPTTSLAGCPPPLSNTVSSVDLGAGAFTPRQIIVLADGSRAYVTSNLGQLLGLTVSGSARFGIALANGAAAFTGGSTLDSKMVYVGGSDNNVHRIDTSAGTDAQQISVSFTPNLVAVKPK